MLEGLHLGEGLETALTGMSWGFRPAACQARGPSAASLAPPATLGAAVTPQLVIDGRIEALEARVQALEDENARLRQYAGQTRAMAMSAIVGLARVELHVGLADPTRKPPPGLPIKMLVERSGYSESGLRKKAKAAQAAGAPIAEQIGGRWFFDPDKLPAK